MLLAHIQLNVVVSPWAFAPEQLPTQLCTLEALLGLVFILWPCTVTLLGTPRKLDGVAWTGAAGSSLAIVWICHFALPCTRDYEQI